MVFYRSSFPRSFHKLVVRASIQDGQCNISVVRNSSDARRVYPFHQIYRKRIGVDYRQCYRILVPARLVSNVELSYQILKGADLFTRETVVDGKLKKATQTELPSDF